MFLLSIDGLLYTHDSEFLVGVLLTAPRRVAAVYSLGLAAPWTRQTSAKKKLPKDMVQGIVIDSAE